MKSIAIFASAVLATFGAGCQVDEGADFGGGAGGAGGAPVDGGAIDAGTSDGAATGDSNGNGTGGAPMTSGTGGTPTGGAGGEMPPGDAGGAGAPPDAGAPSVCDGTGTRVLTADNGKIDNFEGATLDPSWSTFSDVAAAPNSAKMMIQAGGAVGTAHAGHYAGKGAITTAMGGYGVGAVFNIAIDKSHNVYCVDISLFDGVTFWAKANQPVSATNSNKLGVDFVLPETNAASVGGDCPDASMKCYNHPRKTVALTNNWAQYAVTFAEATNGSSTVMNRLQQLAFLSADSNWDYSIDEIQLYKGTPPAGAVPTN
jgi:hypothetical protein